ncbi:hypothetical protein IE53DRAFT_383590 [Violaceomyces palustris]|uniref:Uncharacterized protein n=1 Tax=Violaceomyces palustris TaxID=1673888 RepID=A0ACD0P779_9BASI|nr:hypothetical protein IE53DRAFT_383590 [Violaceomyces palustris]
MMSAYPSCSFSFREGADQSQLLPNELLRLIFLQCDPATLYTSVRSLNKSWRYTVENQLFRDQFTSNRWRVGLRVSKKVSAVRADGSHFDSIDQDGQEDPIETLNALAREGVSESHPASRHLSANSTHIVHVIPLTFSSYDPDNLSLRFDTGSEWHALFKVPSPLEAEDEEADQDGRSSAVQRRRTEVKADSSRLEMDFAIVWRFPGDGQGGDDEAKQDYWGSPDPENGWLSRFYCSNFDVKRCKLEEATTNLTAAEDRILRSTPMATRTRRAELHPFLAQVQREEQEDNVSEPVGRSQDLTWSDEGHEYLSLDLSLGMDFFVKRSARANQLLRRLEAEAFAAQLREASPSYTFSVKQDGSKKKKKKWNQHHHAAFNSVSTSACASGSVTPKELSSPPPSRITSTIEARRNLILPASNQGLNSHTNASPLARLASTSGTAAGTSSSSFAPSFCSPLASGQPLEEGKKQESEYCFGEKFPPAPTPGCPQSLAPSRRGGGSVALSSLGSSSRSRAGNRSGSSTPRAKFVARLCRAEMMPSTKAASCSSSTSSPWAGGDKFGRGSYRIAKAEEILKRKQVLLPCDFEDDLEQDDEAGDSDADEESDEETLESPPLRTALLKTQVSTPAVWTWSRGYK